MQSNVLKYGHTRIMPCVSFSPGSPGAVYFMRQENERFYLISIEREREKSLFSLDIQAPYFSST